MNKRIEHIYNNNFNFTNNLILKKRKQNQVIALISIALLILIAYLFTNSFKDNKNNKEELNKLDSSKHSDIKNKFAFKN